MNTAKYIVYDTYSSTADNKCEIGDDCRLCSYFDKNVDYVVKHDLEIKTLQSSEAIPLTITTEKPMSL